MAKYSYYLTAGPYGGEHTIGTIPKKVAKYWLDQGADAFGEYMLDGDHDSINDSGEIPKEYQLPIWQELNNVFRISSVVFCNSNNLTVTDVTKLSEKKSFEDGLEVANITLTEGLIGDSDVNAGRIRDLNNECIVYGASNDTGFCSFELLETDQPFDAKKLKFDLTSWNRFKLLASVKYSGKDLGNKGMEILTKQSQECWIDTHKVVL